MGMAWILCILIKSLQILKIKKKNKENKHLHMLVGMAF